MLDTAIWRRPALVLPATAITLAFAMLVPFVVHLAPPMAGVPLGARLLPIFVAPLLAAALFHPSVALLASLVAPTLNRLLIGRPDLDTSLVLTSELLVFSGLMLLARARSVRTWFIAPVAYVVAHVVTQLGMGAVGVAAPATASEVASSLAHAVPGMIVLTLLHGLVLRWQRRPGTGEG